jgi:hypothetical protein
VDPAQWETELQGKSWLAAVAVFISLIALAIVTPYTLTAVLFSLLLFMLLCLHCVTFHYATMRPGEYCLFPENLNVQISQLNPPCLAELCTVKQYNLEKRRYGCFRTRFRVDYWRNYLSLVVIVLETAQLLAIAQDQRWVGLNSLQLFGNRVHEQSNVSTARTP